MDYIYVAPAITLLLAIYYHYLTKNYGYWKKKGIPYVTDIRPGFGNVYDMFFLRQSVFQAFQDLYGRMPGCSMVGVYFGREPGLLVREPELVKTVLQTNFVKFSSNGVVIDPEIDRLRSKDPFMVSGKMWKPYRQQFDSALTSGKLKFMYKTIETTVYRSFVEFLNKKIEEGKGEVEIELKDVFSKYTAEAIAGAAFGVEGHSFGEEGIFVELGKCIFKPSCSNAIKQLAVLFVPFIAKLFNTGEIPATTDRAFRNLVNDMIRYRADHHVERNDFLQSMINLKESGASGRGVGRDVDKDTITSHSATFLLDGSEKSSTTMAFLGYQLARHPEIQQRVRDEISAVVEKYGGITYDAIQEMTYLEQAINESMRLYPPVGHMFKVCTKPTELTGSDGLTCEVEPGMGVHISIIGLQMDPEHWPNPQKFDPDRFSKENNNSRHKLTFLAFNAGPRVCSGQRIAMLLIKAAVATTIKNYSLELSAKTQLPIKLHPHFPLASPIGGLWVHLKPL